jgi:hypothetical protein
MALALHTRMAVQQCDAIVWVAQAEGFGLILLIADHKALALAEQWSDRFALAGPGPLLWLAVQLACGTEHCLPINLYECIVIPRIKPSDQLAHVHLLTLWAHSRSFWC